MAGESTARAAPTSPQAYAAFTRRERRGARLFDEVTAEAELPAGLPYLSFGDDFVATEGRGITARMMRQLERSTGISEHETDVERFVREFIGPPLPVYPPSPVLRNAWVMRVRRRGEECQATVLVVEMNPDAPAHLRRIRHEIIEEGPVAVVRALITLASVFRSSRHFAFAEEEAMKKLRLLITPPEYSIYVLTGALRVVGKSNVHYLIRKGRPTLAYRFADFAHGEDRFLATLCMHPLGYHDGTWVGAMPPTDEVIAHLLMIRGDEHRFWKKSEQHCINETVSGI